MPLASRADAAGESSPRSRRDRAGQPLRARRERPEQRGDQAPLGAVEEVVRARVLGAQGLADELIWRGPANRERGHLEAEAPQLLDLDQDEGRARVRVLPRQVGECPRGVIGARGRGAATPRARAASTRAAARPSGSGSAASGSALGSAPGSGCRAAACPARASGRASARTTTASAEAQVIRQRDPPPRIGAGRCGSARRRSATPGCRPSRSRSGSDRARLRRRRESAMHSAQLSTWVSGRRRSGPFTIRCSRRGCRRRRPRRARCPR